MSDKVFVYGTLKKGLGNHRIVKRYVHNAQQATMRGWMFNLGFYPAVVQGSGFIHGQLLTLDQPEKAFSAMDILEGYIEEGHPRNLYERVKTNVTLENGKSVECFAYVFHDRNKAQLPGEQAAFMPTGIWEGDGNSRAKQHYLYFAYGSCMNQESFSSTVSQYTWIGRAEAEGYRVGFTKYSGKWGGGVADLLPLPGNTAEGILYLLSEDEFEPLDVREGVQLDPPMYRRTEITVSIDGLKLPAFTYEVVAKSDLEIAPTDAYVNTIMQGTDVLSRAYVDRFAKHIERLWHEEIIDRTK